MFEFSASVSDDDDCDEGSVYGECWEEDGLLGLSVIPEEDELSEPESEPEPKPETEPLDDLDESPVSVSAPTISSTDGSASGTGLSELGLMLYPEDVRESGEDTAKGEQEAEQQGCQDSGTSSLFQLSSLSDYPLEISYEESTASQNLGKRSASDACLSDNEQDDEKRKHRMGGSTHSSDSVCSIGVDFTTPAGEIISETRHISDSIEGSPGRHSNRPSLIPEIRTTGELLPEQQQHSEVDNSHQEKTVIEDAPQDKEECTDSIDKSTPDTLVTESWEAGDIGAQLIVEELDTQSKIASDELLISSDTDEDTTSESEGDDHELGSLTPVKPSNPAISLTPTSLTEIVAHDGSVTNRAKTENVEPVLETPKTASDDLLIFPGVEGTPAKDDEDDDPGSPTPVRPTRLIIPPSTVSVTESTKSPSMSSSTDIAYPESEPFQHVKSEPDLDLKNGILLVSNPPQANSATYKITITVSVHLQKGKLQGWHDLVIPGLPRVRNGESGFLIFLIPDGCGMELRTTNFRRNSFVENCFFAEFAVSGDLIIPLRICDLRSYGIVKDFTVDYEFIADHDVLDGNKVGVAYNAVCELKLPNRRIWANKCCFFLDIEGGPEGFYQYELDQPCTKFPIIYLASWDRPIGVAHVQITCPPKMFEMFCITWDVKDLSRLETKWLPRIYPGSPGVNGQERYSLRKKFIDALGTAECYEFVEAEEGDTTVEDFKCPEVSVHYAFGDDETSQDQKSDKTLDENGSPRLLMSFTSSLFLLWTVMVIMAMIGTLIIRVFDPLSWSPSIKSIGNATHGDVDLLVERNVQLNFTTTNREYHPANYTNNHNSGEDSPDTIRMVGIDYGSSEYETPIEGEEVELETSSVVGDSGVKLADEPDQPHSGAKPSPSATKASLRDKVDYLLGWKGPTS